jgi:SpoVK/Ycf46/Vps4 family AAA+-type ATPase
MAPPGHRRSGAPAISPPCRWAISSAAPVGTGKTFMVECLAGEAGVPVVKMKNFRDKWVGSTESNLEKIFLLLDALGRCIVFVDEADQALGRRNADSGDSGVSGRVYGMMAERMSDSRKRGRISGRSPPAARISSRWTSNAPAAWM